MRIPALIALAFWFFSAGETVAQPRRNLIEAGAAGQVVAIPQRAAGDEILRLSRAGRRLWSARAQRFEPFQGGTPVPIAPGETAIGITGWTGGAYCCWTLHLFRRGDGGLVHIASLPLGKREPGIVRLVPPGAAAIRLADAAFDFWEVPASLAADLHPTIPFRWTGRALEPDRDAMRRPVAAALGTACADMTAPEDRPPPEQRIGTYPDVAGAVAALRARDWATALADPAPHPGVEAARLAACLLYAGHAAEARRLLHDAWPAGQAGLSETERQLAARLACSPFAAAVRAINARGAPYVGARCDPDGPAQTAVFALGWR
jgi:hypothetical protein